MLGYAPPGVGFALFHRDQRAQDNEGLAAIGTAIGLAGAIVLTKLMSMMRFAIAAVALLACYIPAARNEGRSAGCST